MKKLFKRKIKNKILIKVGDNSSLQKSISLLKRISSSRFNETFEAHINLHSTNTTRNFFKMITFPHYKENNNNKVIVFTTSILSVRSAKAGADLIVGENLSDNIMKKITKFDRVIATPEMLPKLVPFKQELVTKGLLPTIKEETLVNESNLLQSIREFKEGKFKCKTDKTGNIHVKFGNTSFTETQLIENLVFLYSFLKKSNTFNSKRVYFKSIYICTTMSPSIRLNLNLFH